MTTSEARELFEYDSWANARMFAAAGELTQEQFDAVVASSFPAVGATLAHIVSAEWIWLKRWLGDSPTARPSWVARPELTELLSQLAGIESQRESLLASLTDGDLQRPIAYRTMDGQAFANPLGHLIQHVVNHSTYHRGQAATQLRQLGRTPPNTDFTTYLGRNK